MPFITFFYKIGSNPKMYYGKYCIDYISDDHNGLDNEVKYDLFYTLNKFRKNKNLPKLKEKSIAVGVISLSTSDVLLTYSSEKEKTFFDYYRDYDGKHYVNGKLLSM